MHRSNGGIAAVNKDEQLHADIKRHPIGLIIIYVQVVIGFLATAALLYFLFPTFNQNNSNGAVPAFIWIALLLVAVVTLLLLVVVTQIYNQNHLIITSKNVTQVFQRGLFSRQVSELSMANVEDVTAEQRGILAHIFGYGEIRIETAGEQNNFHFVYCPNPDYYGKMILDARQQYVQKAE